jgi:hypothetical protein
MVISVFEALDIIYAPMAEHRDADGKQRNHVTIRTSEGGQRLERANADSFVSNPPEIMVNPST